MNILKSGGRSVLCCVFVALFGCASHHDVAVYRAPYDLSLASPGAKFGALPPPVQNAVRAEAGTAEISDIVKYTPNGMVVYKVVFRNRDLFPPMYIAANGSLLRPDMSVAMGAPADPVRVLSAGPTTGVSLSDVPGPVMRTIQQRVPGAQIAYVDKQTWGDRIVYIAVFADEKLHPRLFLNSDGTILNEGPK